ncbi:MAG TPA: hypothetical protein VKU38_08880 [Ktedonobacteraceae bacterium]|nr:hypothetical protein [Ktedonobacteraceae bacterium]
MKLPEKCFNFVKYFVAIGVTLTVFFNLIVTLPLTAVASQSGVVTLQPTDMQNLIFVWASGTTSIQQRAFHICQTDTISSAHCAEISTDVRGAWLDLMQVDPASLGRMGVQENLTGRTQVYRSLTAQLSALTGGNVTTLLAQSQQALQQVNATLNEANNGLGPATATHYTVWATSFTQHSLPDGLQPASGRYVALPDAYLKYANAGDLSNIPSIYQPYYVPNGTQASWAVTLSLPNGTKKVAKVPVTDVGPWNEDDNWWDANGTSAKLPSSCPVSPTLIKPDATSNPLVNGICPNGKNLRRIYYYLLYAHNGLPFFQPSGYSPTGNFTDGNWPTALPKGCSESTGASLNNDGMTCGGGADGYNAHNGGWLREGTYDQGITNQSSIDLSPAVDKALGWTYPSSGLIQVNVGTLP